MLLPNIGFVHVKCSKSIWRKRCIGRRLIKNEKSLTAWVSSFEDFNFRFNLDNWLLSVSPRIPICTRKDDLSGILNDLLILIMQNQVAGFTANKVRNINKSSLVFCKWLFLFMQPKNSIGMTQVAFFAIFRNKLYKITKMFEGSRSHQNPMVLCQL